MKVAAAVLAAGGSRRLGFAKQTVAVGGVPLVRRAALAALGAGCSPVLVVVGANASSTLAALSGVEVVTVPNPDWRAGLGASLRRALEWVVGSADGPPDALVVLGCDQPALDADVLVRLVAARGPGPDDAAACAYAGVLGTPAVFGRGWFDRLATVTGDRGAAALLREPGAPVAAVSWPAGARDVDRPEDLPAQ